MRPWRGFEPCARMRSRMSTEWLQRGWTAREGGDEAAAEEAFRRALVEDEPDAEYYLGDFLVQTARAEEAEPLLRSVIDSGDIDGHVPLGHALADLGRPDEAAEHFRAAAEAGQASALVDLGVLLLDDLKDPEG